jgi:hypothetical protein
VKIIEIDALISIFVITLIWYSLLYKILASVQATDLMWFLYWVHLPVAIFVVVFSVGHYLSDFKADRADEDQP